MKTSYEGELNEKAVEVACGELEGGGKKTATGSAGRFTVRLHVARAPAKCRRFETEQLTARHASKRQIVWSQTD